MAKRLVMCCDGTWNTPDEARGGATAPTNVTKLALAVAPLDSAGGEQRVFYHRGVGTGASRWDHVVGGTFGLGLSRNVRDAYRVISENFEPGDEVFLFGFSRGAFTARSTAGFIRNSGILRPEHADRLDEAYALYRSRSAHPRGIEARLFRRSYSFETRIRCIGVWDTVGALGIPVTGLPLAGIVNRRSAFHDTTLSTTVDAAFQALAIDERRGPFAPAIWTQQPEAVNQQLEQVWFAGVHCDVGGGYLDPSLPEITLLWMVERARASGLEFEAGAFGRMTAESAPDGRMTGECVAPNALGQIHDSCRGFYKLVPKYDRQLGLTAGGHEYVASSAVERHRELPGYAPAGLVEYLAEAPAVMPV